MGEGAAQGREEGEARVWLIGGPTASGKSNVALRLAERLGARVVNADAQQVYRDLRLLTARPSPADEARAPHRLYGMADAADPWSVGRWLRAVEAELAAGGPVVVVGGTGMYLRALTHGLAATPPVPEAMRAEVQARFAREGEAGFRAALAAVDPAAAVRIAAGDHQRLVRALAVALASGRPLSEWQAQTRGRLSPESWRGVVLAPGRAELYARCDARLEAMVAAGVLDEVAELAARGLEPGLPAMKAVGLREFAGHLRGETSLDEALMAAQRETRRYAKRQSTWFRNQADGWARAATADAALAVLIDG